MIFLNKQFKMKNLVYSSLVLKSSNTKKFKVFFKNYIYFSQTTYPSLHDPMETYSEHNLLRLTKRQF